MKSVTLYDYIRSNYVILDSKKSIEVSVFDEGENELLFSFKGTPEQIFRRFSFYDLNMLYVKSNFTKGEIDAINVEQF